MERAILRTLVERKLDNAILKFVSSHEEKLRENGVSPEQFPDFIWMLISEATAAHFVKKLGKKS